MQSVVLLCSCVIPMHSTPLNVAAAILHSLNLQIFFVHHKLHPFTSTTMETQMASFILHTTLGLTCLLLELLAVQHRDREYFRAGRNSQDSPETAQRRREAAVAQRRHRVQRRGNEEANISQT